MIRQVKAEDAGAAAAFLDGSTLVNRWMVAFFRNFTRLPSETLPYWSLWAQSRPGARAAGGLTAVVAHSFHTGVTYLGAETEFDVEELSGLVERELLPEKLVGDLPALSSWEDRSPGLFSRALRREELAVFALRPDELSMDLVPLTGFRRANQGDLGRLRELERLQAIEAGDEDPESDFASLLAAGLVFVLEEDGRVAGMIRSNLSDGRFIHAGGVFVAPDRRGRGIGAKLVAGLSERIHRSGETVILDAARSNLPAVASYQKAGFREIASGLALRFPEETWNRPG